MKRLLVPAIIVYLLSAGITFAGLSMVSKNSSGGLINPADIQQTAVPTADPSNRLVVAPEAPRSEECPLNGKMYTVTERESWDKRRPLFFLI